MNNSLRNICRYTNIGRAGPWGLLLEVSWVQGSGLLDTQESESRSRCLCPALFTPRHMLQKRLDQCHMLACYPSSSPCSPPPVLPPSAPGSRLSGSDTHL
ncbi:hypothetical protein DPX16_19498 [Anabarilius grahami]|uniref:Uncharacterized protein n=1 Tax=Anabarilius grahami TaxID=495550 RepID=A0A3N0Y7R2_ANAGA|nr:hypothetical protein DPX16_19498 [Anabarilius grahami]